MDATQLRNLIVRPALLTIDMHSDAAENLLMGTAAQESRLRFVKQLGDGPALGLFQMEPATYDDIWASYLEFRPGLASRVRRAIATDRTPSSSRLIWDIRFAAIMCRLHYRRVPEALPNAFDVWGLASYWKRFYNSALGDGTEQQFVNNYSMVT